MIAAPGARYDGHSGSRLRAEVIVAKKARRLAGFAFGFRHGRCSNGDHYYSGFSATIKRGARISRDGRVSFNSGFQRNAYYITARGKKVIGREALRFSLRFTGDHLAGQLKDVFVARGLRCDSGTVPLRAYRDGTPGAPLRTRRIITGRYRTAGLSQFVFTPQDWVQTLGFRWTLYCPTRDFHEKASFVAIPIHGRQFAVQGKGHGRLRNGDSYYVFYRVFGRFFSNPAPTAPTTQVQYGVTVDWHWQETLRSPSGRKLGECQSGYPTYTAYAPLAKTGR